MGCYHKILVALDGSPDAESALMHAISLARDQNARITLLTVGPTVNRSAAVGTAPPPDLIEVHQEILRDATDLIPHDIGVTTRLERGDAAATILRVAREEEDDLIVMGSHGHSRIHRALLGSISQRILAQSQIPVLLMRGNGCGESAPAEEPARAEAAGA
ncbi:MAG TPA: universal stress protein [Solirubrobacterales bacterium]|jgi:nucleotide-binding universal stress UspA family protein